MPQTTMNASLTTGITDRDKSPHTMSKGSLCSRVCSKVCRVRRKLFGMEIRHLHNHACACWCSDPCISDVWIVCV
jgi:hypothetical protein